MWLTRRVAKYLRTSGHQRRPDEQPTQNAREVRVIGQASGRLTARNGVHPMAHAILCQRFRTVKAQLRAIA